MKPRVLLLLELQLARQARTCLRRAGLSVVSAASASAALRRMRDAAPDLLVLDLELPDQQGWAVARALGADANLASVPLLVLTGEPDDVGHVPGLELSAAEFIVRPFHVSELAARARLVLQRRQLVPTIPPLPRLCCGDLQLDTHAHQVTVRDRAIELTPTEFEILRVFLENPGCALTREQLLPARGDEPPASARVLDSHVRNLRRKIEPNPQRATLIRTVYGLGYRLVCT